MATNSFQEGMQSGAALFAPFAQAQAQVNQLRIAQQQELARRLFAQQQLEQQLAARQSISNNELAARENLQKAQQLFAAQEAAKAREATANENEFKRDFEADQIFQAQEAAYQKQQDLIENQTQLAQGAIEKIEQLKEAERLFLQPNSNDHELAIAQASSFVDAPVKRLAQKEETAEMYASRASQKDPEWAAAYQSAVASIIAQKADSPALQQIQNGIDLYGGMVGQAVRGGLVDASALFAPQQQQAQAEGDPRNVADFADSLNALINQDQLQSDPPPTGPIPSSPGLLFTAPRVIAEGVGGAIQGIGGLVEDARRGIFGQPEVSESDITDTKKFAESLGVTDQQFDLLSNAEKRELNQRRIKSNSFKKAPQKPSSFVPIFGF